MPEETIGTAWLGDAVGSKKYAHSVTSAVYDPESGQTLDEVIHPAYSTAEQWTGEWWEDPESGKQHKIYCKVWVTGALPPGNHAITQDADIRQPIGYGGTLFLQRGDTWPFPQAFVQGTTNYTTQISTINYPNSPNQFVVSIGASFTGSISVTKAHLWIKYIKND